MAAYNVSQKAFELPFDVLSRLRAWGSVSEHERVLVADKITETQSTVQTIEHQLEMLKQDRKHQKKSLRCYKSLLAPIRSLPLEILSEILLLSSTTEIVYSDKSENDYPDSDSSESSDTNSYIATIRVPGARLRQVCKLWNTIFTSPTLWSSISLQLDTLPSVLSHSILAKAKNILTATLAMSQDCPLHVKIHYRHPHSMRSGTYNSHDSKYLNLLHILLDTCPRWKSATLNIQHNFAHTIDFPQLSNPMPHLQSLTLALQSYSPRNTSKHPIYWGSFFLNTPKLRHATVNDKAFMTAELPWSQLHSLRIPPDLGVSDSDMQTHLSFSRIRHVFSQCQALKTLEWRNNIYPSPTSDMMNSSKPLTMRIESLALHRTQPEITSFKYPALTDLFMSLSAMRQDLHPIAGARSTLRTLELSVRLSNSHTSTNVVEDVLKNLGQLPQLTKLIISFDNFRCRLAPFDLSYARQMLPKLQDLTCKVIPTPRSRVQCLASQPRIVEFMVALAAAFVHPGSEHSDADTRYGLRALRLYLPRSELLAQALKFIEDVNMTLEVYDTTEDHVVVKVNDSDSEDDIDDMEDNIDDMQDEYY